MLVLLTTIPSRFALICAALLTSSRTHARRADIEAVEVDVDALAREVDTTQPPAIYDSASSLVNKTTRGPAMRISDMTRSQLVSKVFQLCDVDEDGLLVAAEMEPFARETGFKGTLQEWTSEFNTLCEENDIDSTRGLSFGLLQKLVNDESDKGCYCTDQELRDMIYSFDSHIRMRLRIEKLERAASFRPRPKTKAQVLSSNQDTSSVLVSTSNGTSASAMDDIQIKNIDIDDPAKGVYCPNAEAIKRVGISQCTKVLLSQKMCLDECRKACHTVDKKTCGRPEIKKFCPAGCDQVAMKKMRPMAKNRPSTPVKTTGKKGTCLAVKKTKKPISKENCADLTYRRWCLSDCIRLEKMDAEKKRLNSEIRNNSQRHVRTIVGNYNARLG